MSRELPTRISPDAILEAIIEIRYSAGDLPEIFMGKLLSAPVFEGLAPSRLPEADIPFSAREADPRMRFQPIYQLLGTNELIRVGTGAVSLHLLPPYSGWETFRNRAREIFEAGWSDCGHPPLQRCGLRYVNALTAADHGVRSINDLNLSVSVAGEDLVDVTVSFMSEDDATEAIVRVASSKHVNGDLPEDTSFVIDVEVRTKGDITEWKVGDLMDWLEAAHETEKGHFFGLLPEEIVEPLRDI
jgi:uncharacterized protein (TIGR04255 family)